MLKINKEKMSEIFKHCEDNYPEEACGYIYKNGEVHLAENIQNMLHDLDSRTYPRDAKRGYTLSIKDLKELENSLGSINPVESIYHSHPDVGAYFSSEDKEKALYEGELIYPVSYVVVDVKKKKSHGAKQFEYFNNEFVCTAEYDKFGEKFIN